MEQEIWLLYHIKMGINKTFSKGFAPKSVFFQSVSQILVGIYLRLIPKARRALLLKYQLVAVFEVIIKDITTNGSRFSHDPKTLLFI